MCAYTQKMTYTYVRTYE